MRRRDFVLLRVGSRVAPAMLLAELYDSCAGAFRGCLPLEFQIGKEAYLYRRKTLSLMPLQGSASDEAAKPIGNNDRTHHLLSLQEETFMFAFSLPLATVRATERQTLRCPAPPRGVRMPRSFS
jgi:hypothetical protein